MGHARVNRNDDASTGFLPAGWGIHFGDQPLFPESNLSSRQPCLPVHGRPGTDPGYRPPRAIDVHREGMPFIS